MKEKSVIETRISELVDIVWLYTDTPDGDIEEVCTDEQIAAAAKKWKMTPEAVKAIKTSLEYMAETIVDLLTEDLRDLWETTHK